jgi:hypothetical protein
MRSSAPERAAQPSGSRRRDPHDRGMIIQALREWGFKDAAFMPSRLALTAFSREGKKEKTRRVRIRRVS